MEKQEYGTTWWGEKWLQAISRIDYGDRLSRGLSYARTDKIWSLDINEAEHLVEARVCGRHDELYDVSLRFPQVNAKKLKLFMDEASKDIEIISLFTNRELSPKLLTLAQKHQINLFPSSWNELNMSCSCPDWAVPCKHIAAVFYKLVALFDANPELIFQLIGIDLQYEFEVRNVLSVTDQSKNEVPLQRDLYKRALIGPEQLKEIAAAQNFDLTLTLLDEQEQDLLYKSSKLKTYKEGEVIFDEALRKEYLHISQLKKQESLFNDALAHASGPLKYYAKKAETIKKQLENIELSLPKNLRVTKSQRHLLLEKMRAQLNENLQANEETIKNITHRQELNKAQLKAVQKELKELQAQSKEKLKQQHAYQKAVLACGYDAASEKERLDKEEQERQEALKHSKEQEIDAAFIRELDAIDNGDDGSDGYEDKADVSTAASAAVDSADTATVAEESNATSSSTTSSANADAGRVQMRRYMGSIEQLERLTYELTIPDVGDSIMHMFAESSAGYSKGKLREYVKKYLDKAALLAKKQMSNNTDRDLVTFDFGKLYQYRQHTLVPESSTQEGQSTVNEQDFKLRYLKLQPVDEKCFKLSSSAPEIYKKAVEILTKGEKFKLSPIDDAQYLLAEDCLDTFSAEPLASRGYFSHGPLFAQREYLLTLEPNVPMNVSVYDKGKSTTYRLIVAPMDADECKEREQNFLKKYYEQKSLISLVVSMHEALQKGNKITIPSTGGKWKQYVQEAPEDSELNMTGLYQMFSGFTAKQNLSAQSLEIRILYCLWFIASALVRSHAIMPRLQLSRSDFMGCYWLPATIDPAIRDMVTKVGLALQGYEHWLFNRRDRQYYLHPTFLGEMVLTPFIQSYVSWAYGKATDDCNALSVIFSSYLLQIEDIEKYISAVDLEITRYCLENWLAPINLSSELRYIPVLRFVDLAQKSDYEHSFFAQMQTEIEAQAQNTSKEQQERKAKLLENASDDEASFIQKTASALDAADASLLEESTSAKESKDSTDCLLQYGVGMELGFVQQELSAEQQQQLQAEGLMDDTGFIPLYEIINNKKLQYMRNECLRITSRLGALEPQLIQLLSSNFNVKLLSLAEVYQTITIAQSSLQMLGVRLIMPRSLKHLLRPDAIMRVDLEQHEDTAPVRSFLDLNSMLDFSWRVAVGDHLLTGSEFEFLMANAGQVVRFKDEFIYVDPELLSRIEKRYSSLQQQKTSKSELLIASLTGNFADYDVRLSNKLQQSFDKLLTVEEIALPEGLKKQPDNVLREYQVRGYEWLVRNARIQVGSILADDMGLGKTLQVLATLLRLKEDGQITSEHPALVVVPTSLLPNWIHEIKHRADNLSIFTFYGSGTELKEVKEDIILTSYGTARNRIKELQKWHFSVMVIDEAQAIKSMNTALNKSLRSIKADNFIAMSGTPVENRLLEYYSILDFVNRGMFGTATKFKERFATPIERDRDLKAVNSFKRLSSPFILRRLKTDKKVISDLPDKIIADQYCALSPNQASLYQAIVDSKMEQIKKSKLDDAERRAMVLSLIQNLKAVCNSPAQYAPDNEQYDPADSGKVERLLELLDDILEGKDNKVLIFTQSVIMGRLLQKIIGEHCKHTPEFLYGGLNPEQRALLVDKFQHDATERVLLLSLRAAGTGLNLTAANNVIHFDLWWNPAVENQATDRAFRIGQTRKVNVYRFICAHTFEERINSMINAKRDLADLTVVSGENWIGNLSNRQLEELFSLSQPEED